MLATNIGKEDIIDWCLWHAKLLPLDTNSGLDVLSPRSVHVQQNKLPEHVIRSVSVGASRATPPHRPAAGSLS